MSAAVAAASRLRVEVWKNFRTASSSHDGELETSMIVAAPATAAPRPSPVIVLTPVLGVAASASWPCSPSKVTSFEPINPVPPMTTIFTAFLSRAGTLVASGQQLRPDSASVCDSSTGKRESGRGGQRRELVRVEDPHQLIDAVGRSRDRQEAADAALVSDHHGHLPVHGH